MVINRSNPRGGPDETVDERNFGPQWWGWNCGPTSVHWAYAVDITPGDIRRIDNQPTNS
jgi:hypothetical protein